MKTKRIYGIVLVLAILFTMFTPMNIVTAQQQAESVRFNEFKNYGVYFDAAQHYDSPTGSGLDISYSKKDSSASFYLWEVATEMEEMKQHVDWASKGAVITKNIEDNNAKYATFVSGDSGYKFTNKDGFPALLIAPTATVREDWCAYAQSNLYFSANRFFTDEDTDVTFIINYLDIGEQNIKLQYVNQDYDDKKDEFEGSTIYFPRGNTGEWVTKAISVTDAKLTPGLKNTALQNHERTIKISGEGAQETYIRTLAVVRTKDFQTIKSGYNPLLISKTQYFVNGVETDSVVPKRNDIVSSKLTATGTGKVSLISALYDRGDLREVVYDTKFVDGYENLETSITVPNMDESWEYKTFIWDSVETLQPLFGSKEELVLKATGTINSVSLVWDSADGNMEETVYLYRDSEKIATVTGGLGGYIDYVQPGTYKYYIKNESGRTSDIITATSIDLFDHVKSIGGVYIQAGSSVDTDIFYGMKGMKTNLGDWYDGKNESSKLTTGTYVVNSDGSITDNRTYHYYQGWKSGSDSAILRAKGLVYPTTNNKSEQPFTTVPEMVTAADGESYAFFSPGNTLRQKSNKKTEGNVTTTSYTVVDSSARMTFTIDPDKFKSGEYNYTVFVEYWGTGRTKNIGLQYSKTGMTDNAQSGTATLALTGGAGWQVARVDLTDAQFGDTSKFGPWDTGMPHPAISITKKGQDLFVRRVVIVPTKVLSSYGTSWYTGSQSTGWINNITQEAGHFGPSTDYFRQYGNTTTKSGVVDFTQLTETPASRTYGSDGLQLRTYTSGVTDGYTEFVLNDGTKPGYLKMYENPNRSDRAISKHRWVFDDDYIYGMRDSSLQVAITYRSYNVPSGRITYSKASSGSASESDPNLGFVSISKTVNFNTDGELHTLVVDLEDANSMSHVFCESIRNDFAIEAGVKDPDDNIDGYDSEGNPHFLAVYRVEIRRPDNRLMQDLSKQ